jgi:replicative DNA helicase
MIATLKQKLVEVVDRIETAYGQKDNLNSTMFQTYIKTGIHGIDNKIGGIPRAGVTDSGISRAGISLIASDRGHVSTSFAMGIALSAALDQKISTVIVDTQRNETGVAMRLLSILSQVPIGTFTTGCLEDSDWSSLTKALTILDNVPILIEDDKPDTTLNLMQSISEMCLVNDVGLVVIDGLNFEGLELSDADQYLQDSHWRRFENLFAFSIKSHVPVIVASQLRYSPTNDERDIPSLSDVPLELLEWIDLVIAPYSSKESGAEHMQPHYGGIAVLKSIKGSFVVKADFNSGTGSFVQKI